MIQNIHNVHVGKIVLFSILITFFFYSQSCKATVATAATIGAGVDTIGDEIDSKIDSATQAGELLIAKGAMEVRSLLDLWKEKNANLLDKSFDEINDTARETLLGIEGIVTQFDGITEQRMIEVRSTIDQVTVTMENIIILGKGRSFILRYEPQIIPPNIEDIFTLIVKGVNLGDSSFTVDLPTDKHTLNIKNENEIEVLIDSDNFKKEEGKSKRVVFDVTYNTKSDWRVLRVLGVKKNVTRTISLILLPKKIGSFEVKLVHTNKEKIVETFTANVGGFSGRHTTRKKVARPKNGFLWDIDNRAAFRAIHNHGDGGRCHPTSANNPIWNESNKHGVTITARLDDRDRGFNRRDGHAFCSLTGPVFKMVNKDVPSKLKGDITWLKDIPLVIKDPKSNVITVTLFDGRKIVGTIPMVNKYFKVKRLTKDKAVIQPIVPELAW